MKKVLGWILICIPIINILGTISNPSIPHSPLGIIILVIMFLGGIAMISSSKKNKSEDNETE